MSSDHQFVVLRVNKQGRQSVLKGGAITFTEWGPGPLLGPGKLFRP